MTINIKEEAFDVLHQNLLDIEPKYRSKEVILCPLCLTELLKSEGKKWGIEQIVPQNVVKEDPASLTGTIPKT